MILNQRLAYSMLTSSHTEYAKSWPNITQKKDQPADAKEFEGVEGKFEKYFSREPGAGD